MVPGDELLLGFGQSNGARAVSAVPASRKITKPTNCGTTNQVSFACTWTMSTSESDRAIRITPSTLSASETSYETSCAHVRIDPSSAYFESDDQPPMMKP